MQIEVQCTQWEGGGFWYGGKIKTEVKNEEVPPCELGTYPAFYSPYQKKKSWRIQTIRNHWTAAMKWRDTLQWRRVWKSVSTCWMPLFLSGTAWGDLWRPDSEPELKTFMPTASGLEAWELRNLVGCKTFSKSSELTCPWFEKLESLIGRPKVDTVSTPRSC